MKLSDILLKMKYRSTVAKPRMENYIYDYYRTPILSNKVSTTNRKSRAVPCVNELQNFMVCLKKSDFDEQPCKSCFELYEKCLNNDQIAIKKRKALIKSGGVIKIEEETGKFSKDKWDSSEVNRMLKKIPTPPQPHAYYYKRK